MTSPQIDVLFTQNHPSRDETEIQNLFHHFKTNNVFFFGENSRLSGVCIIIL